MFTHIHRWHPKLTSKRTIVATDNKRNNSNPSNPFTTETNKECTSTESVKPLSTIKITKRRMYTFSFDEAPEDEMRGSAQMREKALRSSTTTTSTSAGGTNPQKERQRDPPAHYNIHMLNSNKKVTLSSADDEPRDSPPSMEIVTDASSNHPDFEAWKRDMTMSLMSGSVKASSNKNLDWKSSRLNKRRREKKLLHQQLRSVKSDTSTTTESESSDEEQSSIEACHSSSFPNTRKSFSARESRSMHDIRTVCIRGKSKKESCPLTDTDMITLSPRSAAFSRPSLSAVEMPMSPKKEKPNSSELAEIMVELSDLKTWAEGDATSIQARKPTPPPSPKEELVKEDPPAVLPTCISAPELKDSMLPKEPEKKHKTTIEKKVQSKDNGIPTMLTITKKETVKVDWVKPKKKKKRVRFCKGFVTDIFYRPWTREEDIDDLFFQEEELLTWEKDEKTTLRDRFEVVVTDLGDDQTFTGKMSIGTPVISFHNSYSYSFHESSDEESCGEE